MDAANGNSPFAVTADSSVHSVVVGDTGVGVLDQSAGKFVLATSLTVGRGTGSNGTFNLGGTGQFTAADVIIGFNGTGVFHQTGGAASFTNLALGGDTSGGLNPATGAGTYTLGAGSVGVTGANVNIGAGTRGAAPSTSTAAR